MSETRNHSPKSQDLIWVFSLAVAAVLIRLIPHPYNMTPVGALALFAGCRLRSWWAFVVPLAVMAVSDVALIALREYRPFDPWVYGGFALYVLAGWAIVRADSPLRIGLSAVGCSVLFFLITNFGSWLALPQFYPRTWEGLLQSYAAAIPFYTYDPIPLGFFSNTVLGDLVYSALIFGLYAYWPASRDARSRAAS
jgi:hypothetical protein